MEFLRNFKEIDAPWVLEIIAGRFGFSVIHYMRYYSALVYGGATRDALAELPLQGDLDIAIPPHFYTNMVAGLRASPKWAQIKNEKTRKSRRLRLKKAANYFGAEEVLIYPPDGAEDMSREYAKNLPAKNLPFSGVIKFVNSLGNSLQLIRGNETSENSVLEIVQNVDIRCCGIAMDFNGVLYEIVDGAAEDCEKRILRLNEVVLPNLDVNSLKFRISKLERRGWKSEIDLNDLKQKKTTAGRCKSPKIERQAKNAGIQGANADIIEPRLYGGASFNDLL